MKPLGPIPPGFGPLNGVLSVSDVPLDDLIARAGGTPLFVYSRALIEQRVAALRDALPRQVRVNYAIKANSLPAVLCVMRELVDGFDIASGGELDMAAAAGMPGAQISFAGPGKRDEELRAAIAAGLTINLESETEAERALAIGRNSGIRPRLAIRVNPDFELRGSGMKMGGGAKPFGIDADRVAPLMRRLAAEPCVFRGLHIFAGSQSLDTDAIIEAQAKVLALAHRLALEAELALPMLNMGGGFGIPYFAGDRPIALDAVGAALHRALGDLPPTLAGCEMHLELGRYLVGEAGVYLTRIVDHKVSHGETFLVTDGGLHHQLAASGNFGAVVRRNYPVAIANRLDHQGEEEVNIVGCLCTPLDRLADKAWLPHAGPGDIVAVFCAGAYGASASPSAFLGHGPAAEILV